MTTFRILLSVLGLAIATSCKNLPDYTPPPIVIPPVVVNPPAPQTGCQCDLSRPLLTDVRPIRAVTEANPHGEECGLQEEEGKQIRPIVSLQGNILTVSSIYLGNKIKPVDNGWEIPCPIEWNGYSWHCFGYAHKGDHVENCTRFAAGERRIIPRSFTFIFVEARQVGK